MTDLLPSATIAEPAPLLEAFLTGRNPQTLRAYERDLETFRAFVNAATVRDAVAGLLAGGQGAANGTVLRFRAYLATEKHAAPATINRALSALRALLKLARILGAVSWTLDVPNAEAIAYRDTRGPGVAGVKRLMATTQTGDAERQRANIRDRAILRLLYDLGLRRAEVCSLDVGDMDLERRAVSVAGKRRVNKTLLTLPQPTADAVRDWLAVRGTEPGALFLNFDHAQKGDGLRLSGNSVYRIVRGRGAVAGVKVAPHGLRHTAITEACKAAHAAGIPLEEVMDFSRHRDVKVLMIYRDRERDVQGELAAAVAAASD